MTLDFKTIATVKHKLGAPLLNLASLGLLLQAADNSAIADKVIQLSKDINEILNELENKAK